MARRTALPWCRPATAAPCSRPALTMRSSLPIDDIQVGFRYRKDLGDLRSLADSIGEVGLLHPRSEEHTSELQSLRHLACRLLLEKKATREAHVLSALLKRLSPHPSPCPLVA